MALRALLDHLSPIEQDGLLEAAFVIYPFEDFLPFRARNEIDAELNELAAAAALPNHVRLLVIQAQLHRALYGVEGGERRAAVRASAKGIRDAAPAESPWRGALEELLRQLDSLEEPAGEDLFDTSDYKGRSRTVWLAAWARAYAGAMTFPPAREHDFAEDAARLAVSRLARRDRSRPGELTDSSIRDLAYDKGYFCARDEHRRRKRLRHDTPAPHGSAASPATPPEGARERAAEDPAFFDGAADTLASIGDLPTIDQQQCMLAELMEVPTALCERWLRRDARAVAALRFRARTSWREVLDGSRERRRRRAYEEAMIAVAPAARELARAALRALETPGDREGPDEGGDVMSAGASKRSGEAMVDDAIMDEPLDVKAEVIRRALAEGGRAPDALFEKAAAGALSADAVNQLKSSDPARMAAAEQAWRARRRRFQRLLEASIGTLRLDVLGAPPRVEVIREGAVYVRAVGGEASVALCASNDTHSAGPPIEEAALVEVELTPKPDVHSPPGVPLIALTARPESDQQIRASFTMTPLADAVVQLEIERDGDPPGAEPLRWTHRQGDSGLSVLLEPGSYVVSVVHENEEVISWRLHVTRES